MEVELIKYVTYNENGELTGAYWQELLPEHADNHLEVEDSVRLNWNSYRYDLQEKVLELIPVNAKQIVPQTVPMRSARVVLLQRGLLAQVQHIIETMPNPAGEFARIDWEFALTVDRNSPIVKEIIPSLGKTEAQIDQMFIDAAKL